MSNKSGTGDLPDSMLLPFLLLTFGIAWGLFALFALFPAWMVRNFGPLSGHHPLFILAVYAPAIAALGLVLVREGLIGCRLFLARLAKWRVGGIWWAFLLLGIPMIFIMGSALKGNLATYEYPFSSLGEALAAMGFMLVLGPMEELGWRGVALPLLQRRLAPLWAGLVVGLIWGLWHLPAFLMSGTPQSAWAFTPFVIAAMAISVILTPLFNASGGSILLAMLFHFQLNNPLWPDAQPYDALVVAVVAIAVTVINRKTMCSRGSAIQRVIPERRS